MVCRRFAPPWAACPVPLASETVGVSSSSTVAGSPSGKPRPLASRALRVGGPGGDEAAVPAVAAPDVGGGKTQPFRIEPETGQVSEYGAECPQNRTVIAVSHTPRAGFHSAVGSRTGQAPDVLDEHERRPQ